MNCKPLVGAIFLGLGLSATTPVPAQPMPVDADALAAKIAAMQAQMEAMQLELDALRRARMDAGEASLPEQTDALQEAVVSTPDADTDTDADGIRLGGAVRWQFSREGSSAGNRKRNGDMDFDIFRLDLNGSIGDVILSTEYRWFQYMDAIHHAWVGYEFSPETIGRAGIIRLPFGNQPYNSHGYFLSANYYLGLEEAYHTGLLYEHDSEHWNAQLGFFKNDSMGGVDGYVSDRSHSYTFNVVGWRGEDEGINDDPLNPIGTANTGAARVAYTFRPGTDARIEVGASALAGSLHGPERRAGRHDAGALHLNADIGAWNLQLQTARYAYRLDNGADRVAVGAYAFFDTLAARAHSHTGNIAYHVPVSWGPISGLTFYNDHTRVTHKSGGLPDTWTNITGMSLAAGGLLTFFDFVTARNQPFVGGSMAGNGGTEHRLNVNVGYYF